MIGSAVTARSGSTSRLLASPAQVDAAMGMAWFNGLSRRERAHWFEIAGSSMPADAWLTFKAARSARD